jgi:hypothetical protein
MTFIPPDPCVAGCYSDPPEPAWNDTSGDEIPAAPPLNHGVLGLAGCATSLPAQTPVYDPICIGTCDEENDLIPGCYDAGPYQIISDCELVDVVSCFGTGQIRMPSRWQIVGETPNTFTETGTIVWESGVLDLTDDCTEDTGYTELVVPVSREAASWRIVNSPCLNSSGTDQGPYDVVLPQILNVLLTRSCGTPPP